MIAAIYARKSTDQNVADEAKSVTRQIDRARAYAAAKGWTISEGHEPCGGKPSAARSPAARLTATGTAP